MMLKRFQLLLAMILFHAVVEAKITEERIDLNQLRPTQFAIGVSNALDMEKREFKDWIKSLKSHLYGDDLNKKLTLNQIVENWLGYFQHLQKKANDKSVEAMVFKKQYFQLDGHHRTRLFFAGQERLESITRLGPHDFCQKLTKFIKELELPIDFSQPCTEVLPIVDIPKLQISVWANDEYRFLNKKNFYLTMFQRGKMLLPHQYRLEAQHLVNNSDYSENKLKLLNLIYQHIPESFQTIKDYPLRSLVGNAFYNTSIISDVLEDYVEFYFAEKLLEVNDTDEIEDQYKFTKSEVNELESCSEESCSIKGTEEHLIQKTRYIIFNSKTLWKWFNEHIRVGQQAKADTMLQNAKSKYQLEYNSNKFPAQIKKQLSYDLIKYTPHKKAISPRECNNNSGENDCHPFLRSMSNQHIVKVGHEVKERLDKSNKGYPIKETTSEKILHEDMQKNFKEYIANLKKAKGITN